MSSKCPFMLRTASGERIPVATYPLRPELPELPERMRRLPVDRRGYPVPFFVAWQIEPGAPPAATPEFRAQSRKSQADAITNHVCWVCGQPLAGEQVFVVGPMCTVNRVSSEPPSHRDCARFSAMACPFLTRPHMERREAGLPDDIRSGAGLAILRNPGVTALWFAKRFEIEQYPEGYLWRFSKEPLAVEWYARGRTATRAEVLASIESGVPLLREVSQSDEENAAIDVALARAMRYLPKAA